MPRTSREERLSRVSEVRTAALALLERRGSWKTFENFPHPVRCFEGAGFSMIYRTPQQPVPFVPGLGVSPDAQRRLAGDFELDIWRDAKVFGVSRDEDPLAPMRITAFKSGPWEGAFLDLAARDEAVEPPPSIEEAALSDAVDGSSEHRRAERPSDTNAGGTPPTRSVPRSR